MDPSRPYTKRVKLLWLATLYALIFSQISAVNVVYAQDAPDQADSQTFIPLLMAGSSGLVEPASSGSYNLNWSAADPSVNTGPYSPTYAKIPPGSLACPTPSGGTGLAADPLANAVYGSPKDAVSSLAPAAMALGQIVPFEVRIAVSGSTSPENGVIRFTPYWLAKTTNGGNFGFDPANGVYCAFVDTNDAAASDPGNNAKVDSFTSSTVNAGTSNEQI